MVLELLVDCVEHCATNTDVETLWIILLKVVVNDNVVTVQECYDVMIPDSVRDVLRSAIAIEGVGAGTVSGDAVYNEEPVVDVLDAGVLRPVAAVDLVIDVLDGVVADLVDILTVIHALPFRLASLVTSLL